MTRPATLGARSTSGASSRPFSFTIDGSGFGPHAIVAAMASESGISVLGLISLLQYGVSSGSAHVFPLAAGPHPRRGLTLMPRSGVTGLRSAWPQALFAGEGCPHPPRANARASLKRHGPSLGIAAGAAVA